MRIRFMINLTFVLDNYEKYLLYKQATSEYNVSVDTYEKHWYFEFWDEDEALLFKLKYQDMIVDTLIDYDNITKDNLNVYKIRN